MSLSFLVEHAGLDPSVARKMRREDITLTVLQEATLAERREILRSMGIKYGPILAINRALEKRQRMIEEGELDDAADDEDAVADDDDVPPERPNRKPAGSPHPPPRPVPAGLQAAAMLLRGASAPTLRGLQLILGNALDNPDQVAFRTISWRTRSSRSACGRRPAARRCCAPPASPRAPSARSASPPTRPPRSRAQRRSSTG